MHYFLYFLSLLISQLCFSETRLEYWDFNTDLSGASFDNGRGGIKNSGSHASLWNHGKVSGMAANGMGQFVINGSGSAYRKVAANGFATGVITTGHYQFVVEFSEWNLDSTSKGVLGFEVLDTNGKRVVALLLYPENASESKIRLSAASATGYQGRGYEYAGHLSPIATNVPTRVVIDFNLDTDTVIFLINGKQLKVVSDFSATSLSHLKFFTNAKWSKKNSVSIDSMGLVKLP